MQVVSGFGPFGGGAFGGDDAFGQMSAMFNQIIASFGGDPASGWSHAKQLAGAIANEGQPEANVDPVERLRVEELARVAELQVAQITGLSITGTGRGPLVSAVNRTQWADASLDAYRPLFERLTDSLGKVMREQLADVEPEELEELGPAFGDTDPREFLSGLSQMLGPVMLSMMAGSTVGQLGRRSFGSYDLPIPRPLDEPVLVVVSNLDAFGTDWSLPPDDLRLWICLEELAHRAVLGLPHVRGRIGDLLARHASGFTADPTGIEERLGDLDLSDPGGMAALGDLLGDPDIVLGAIRSPEQAALLPYIDAAVTVVEGYVDWVLDQVGGRLLTSFSQLAEALRRRRVETDQASRFVERLFGLELTQDKLDRGSAFIDGVVERAGADALAKLWDSPEGLPTPAEVDAPGLWLARLSPDADHELPDLPHDAGEIPDFPDLDS
jgi:putative hydrolase